MIPFTHIIVEQLQRRYNLRALSLIRQLNRTAKFTQNIRTKQNKSSTSLSSLFQPIAVKRNEDKENIGLELTGSLSKRKIIEILCSFALQKTIKELSFNHGLDETTFKLVMENFRKYCIESESLPADLHIILNDIIHEAGNITDLFPYFLRFAKKMYPHIDCLDDLKKISDLRNPATWYPIARSRKRKIIFHAGPTNSGKTHQALQRFMSAKSGVYCGPLKLLANEVFNKCNAMGTPCDLITGEEQRYAKDVDSPANHISCSVEMTNLKNTYEVAIIDEIQLLRDPSRGWAWSRALLGIAADEIHLCGEHAAIPLVQSICSTIGESVEIREYQRLTELVIEDKALVTLHNVQPGDCIVCFSRRHVFNIYNAIEKMGHDVAVIYGSLPPGTKISQAARFNDQADPCNILVATNAIGMGLNLHIRRIIFHTVTQAVVKDFGEIAKDTISVSSALQIAGRAGRYGTQWEKGYVTTLKPSDLPVLKKLLQEKPEEVHKAGLHPTAEQIELYAYHLPNVPLSKLIDIFIALCEFDDSLYFICNLNDFKFLADMIEHVPLPLLTRYVFCCAPVNRRQNFTCVMFLKYARQCGRNEPVTISWLQNEMKLPFGKPMSLAYLLLLESVFDALDIYLWLSYRIPDLFPDGDRVKEMQLTLDKMIDASVRQIKHIGRTTESGTTTTAGWKIAKEQLYKKIEKLEMEKLTGKKEKKYTLTNNSVSEGLSSQKMLKELEREWPMERPKKDPKNVKPNFSHKNKHRR